MYGCKLQIKYTVKVGRLFSKEKSKQHNNLSYKQSKPLGEANYKEIVQVCCIYVIWMTNVN